jgi:hypothetical protein
VVASGCQGKSLVNQQESRVCERVLQRFLMTIRKVLECMAVFISVSRLQRRLHRAETPRYKEFAHAWVPPPASVVAGQGEGGGVGL